MKFPTHLIHALNEIRERGILLFLSSFWLERDTVVKQ